MIQALNTLFGVIVNILGSVCNFLISLFGEQRKTTFNANFLPSYEILSSYNKGFCITGSRSMTIEDSFKNVLILGSTGAFKSSGILIPSILKMRDYSSLVINDPSGELLQRTSGALLKAGYLIQTINYSSPDLSEGYNPLLRAKTASDVQKISKMIVRNALGAGGKDPFWNLSAEGVCNLFTKYIVNHTPEEYHTLNNVYLIISKFSYAPDKIDKLFVRAKDQALLSEYKSLIAYGDKTLASIIATCRTALSLFATDPQVALVTSHDTIDFSEFRKQKVALFINNSVNDMRYYSLITSIFLEQFFAETMSHIPGKNELPIFFLLDEASSLYFSSLQITISNIRKYKAGILQIYQSASQIVDLYGQAVARAITENCFARVYMAGQPIHIAQELEATLGKWEFQNDKNVRQLRSLMTADEIHQTKDSIILCGNNPAIKTPVVPYFKQFNLKRLTELPPYLPKTTLPFDTPPLLEIL
jgi:type IV secretion system protein VirD4